jgi:DNA polymerase-3 subunit chi
MTQVVFHIIDEQLSEQANAHLSVACQQATRCYREDKQVFIFTEDKDTAHQLDEMLWQQEPNSFVPHNLPGEGPRGGAPVEISWQAPTKKRQVLINLSQRIPQFASQFNEIIDFVPLEPALKQAARERYKQFRGYGLTVDTQQVVDIK